MFSDRPYPTRHHHHHEVLTEDMEAIREAPALSSVEGSFDGDDQGSLVNTSGSTQQPTTGGRMSFRRREILNRQLALVQERRRPRPGGGGHDRRESSGRDRDENPHSHKTLRRPVSERYSEKGSMVGDEISEPSRHPRTTLR